MSRFDATGRKPVDKWTAAPRLTTSPQANHNNRSGQLIWYINRSTHNVLDRHGGRSMEQSTFAELEHDTKKRRTRREVFLEKWTR